MKRRTSHIAILTSRVVSIAVIAAGCGVLFAALSFAIDVKDSVDAYTYGSPEILTACQRIVTAELQWRTEEARRPKDHPLPGGLVVSDTLIDTAEVWWTFGPIVRSRQILHVCGRIVQALLLGCDGSGELVLVDSSTGQAVYRISMNWPTHYATLTQVADLNGDRIPEIEILVGTVSHGMVAMFVSIYSDSLSFLRNESGGYQFAASGEITTDTGSLDLTGVTPDSVLTELITAYIPPHVASSLSRRQLAPEAIRSHIAASYYPGARSSVGDSLAFVLYSNDWGVLQCFRYQDSSWVLSDTVDSLTAEASVAIKYEDVDCDSIPEVVLTSVTGAAGLLSLDIVKVQNGRLDVLTPRALGKRVVGRRIEVKDVDSDCVKEIEVYLDGPEKYVPNRKRLYRLDTAAATYRLEAETTLKSNQ